MSLALESGKGETMQTKPQKEAKVGLDVQGKIWHLRHNSSTSLVTGFKTVTGCLLFTMWFSRDSKSHIPCPSHTPTAADDQFTSSNNSASPVKGPKDVHRTRLIREDGISNDFF